MKPIGLVPELLVKDIKKSLDFYLNVLGFNIVYSRKEVNFAYIKRLNTEIMLEQIGTGREWITGALEYPLGRGINFQIETEKVQELYQTVKQNNIPIFMEMEEKWYQKTDSQVGNKQFIVQDPDGYLLRFYENLGTREK